MEESIMGWFIGRIPDGWFVNAPVVEHDRDEILVVGALAEPSFGEDVGEDDRVAARRSRIEDHREQTRSERVRIARAAEAKFDRKVSWGASCGDQTAYFTTLSSPTMTRLRMPERRLLDTLVSSGVAKSRSEALAWCVKQVAEHQTEWIGELEDAIDRVEEVRRRGPN
jgi:hypothetical protein